MYFNIFLKMSFRHFLSQKEKFALKNDKPKQKVLKITSNAGKEKNLPKKFPSKLLLNLHKRSGSALIQNARSGSAFAFYQSGSATLSFRLTFCFNLPIQSHLSSKVSPCIFIKTTVHHILTLSKLLMQDVPYFVMIVIFRIKIQSDI
jgi:hypothetical protein